MATRLFVGNLPYSVADVDLEGAFAEHGEVVSAAVIRDRETGRSRGFGFVEMASDDQAESAQQAMDGLEMDGRRLRVDEAQPRAQREAPAGRR